MTRPLSGLAAVSLDQLRPSPSNPREQLTDIDGLAASLRESGMIQPIIAQRVPGRSWYQIVAGHRRHAAARKLGWAEVPCIIRRDLLPDQELVTMLVENGQRAGLDPIEEAKGYQHLIGMGLSRVDVADRVGAHPNTVTARLTLLTLPAEEQEQIRAGHLGVTRALANVTEERQRERIRQAGRPVGRPKGATTAPYFGATHALAPAAQRTCDHRGRPKVGNIACGPCWEAVIRADAVGQAAT